MFKKLLDPFQLRYIMIMPLICIFFIFVFNVLFLNLYKGAYSTVVYIEIQVFIILAIFIWQSIFWKWSLGVGIQKYIPNELKLNTNWFKILFFIIIFNTIFIILFLYFIVFPLLHFKKSNEYIIENFSLFLIIGLSISIFLGLVSILIDIYLTFFISKSIKTAQLKKQVQLEDFIDLFFINYFTIIAYWNIFEVVDEIIANYET